MCQFLSAIATKDNRLLFTEDDSHETIITHASLIDDNRLLRGFVRLEQRSADNLMIVDETAIPGWFEENREAWQARIFELYERVRPARDAYNAAVRSARDAYNAAVRPAQDTCDAAVHSARDAYDAAVRPARDAYVQSLSSITGFIEV